MNRYGMQATNELKGKTMTRNIVLLDGGMGQELLSRSDVKPTPLWSAQFLLDKPDIVEGVHRDFIEAGAKVLTLSSYSVTPERLQRDGNIACLLYTSPSPRDQRGSRMPSSA